MNRSVDIPENFSLLISMDVPMNLRPMSLTTQSYRYVVAGVGTLLNMLVVVVIYNSRQLHYPRHVFWAAISVMNQFHIIYNIVEIIAIVGRNQVACQTFVLNAGVPYTIVLTFLAMADFDSSWPSPVTSGRGDRGYVGHFFIFPLPNLFKDKLRKNKSIGVIPCYLFMFGNFFKFFLKCKCKLFNKM
jgi:hypothetical protein